MIIIQLLSLLMALRASSSSQYYVINQGLSQLDDWLEDHVESWDPKENMEAVLKEFSNLSDSLLNRSKLTTVKFLQAVKEAAEDATLECARPHLELIQVIQKSSHAYSKLNLLRTNALLRPYAMALVDKCDQLHEREFERLHSEYATELEHLEEILDDKFIERHRIQISNGSLLHFRVHYFPAGKCCTPVADELADLIQLKSINLKPGEKSPQLLAPLVERRFQSDLGRACSNYLERLADTFELANSASYFDPDDDFHFIAKRSQAYQKAVFRYKFCQDALDKRSQYIEQLVKKLIEEQAPAEAGADAGGK